MILYFVFFDSFCSTGEALVDLSDFRLHFFVFPIEVLRLEIVVSVVQPFHKVDFFLADQSMLLNVLGLLFVIQVVLNILIINFRNVCHFVAFVGAQALNHFLLLVFNLCICLFQCLVIFHVLKNIFIHLAIPVLFLQMLHKLLAKVVFMA